MDPETSHSAAFPPGPVYRLWLKLPIAVRAVAAGLAVVAAGVIPTNLLIDLNTRALPELPWSGPPALLYLWLLWKFLGGGGWPRSTSAARRAALRAHRLSGDRLRWALAAAGCAVVLILGLYLTLLRAFPPPPEAYAPLFDRTRVPGSSVLVWAFTIAIVAGVIEEAGFRGYLQGPLERRYGGAIAIGAASSLFAVIHLPQARVNLPIFSTILVASLIVGTLAFASDSIVPGILAHATIDIVAVPLRLTGRLPPPPLAETGVDAFLVLTFLGVAAGAVGTALSLRRLLGSSPERPGVAAL